MANAIISGGCLCGEVSYRVEGRADRFFHCHCSRCRKATGTGHCSNVLVTDATVIWESGEALVTRFKVPDAERFATSFCSQCGSPLPRFAEAAAMAVIPAGSIDGEPPLQPQARIFTGSKAEWSCADEMLPAFPEYPTA